MVGDPITLRPYRKSDLEAVFRLDQLCFAEEFQFDLDSMRLFAEARNACTVLAESSLGELAGFVIAHLKRDVEGAHAYVLTIDIAEQHRRARVGERLMVEMERRITAAGAAWVGLHAYVGNDAAISFYERMGYQREGRVGGFYRKDLDAWLYRKELTRG